MATLSEGNGITYSVHRPNIVHLGRSHSVKLEGDLQSTTQHQQLENCRPSDETEKENPLEQQDADSVIDIVINNVVCSFNVRCHLNLRQIALTSVNVEYRRENGMLTMKLRNPYTTASIWSSGKITCTGATSEELSKKAARKFARILQNLGFRIRFSNFRVVNVLGTCSMPFGILILKFSQDNRGSASYEPELHPGVTYKIKDLRATLKIFSTGSITITAPSVAAVQQAVEQIYPIVYQYRKEKEKKDDRQQGSKKMKTLARGSDFCRLDEDYDSSDSDY